MKEILRKSELADELGVSRSRISHFVTAGMPVLPSGKVDLEQACYWIVNNIDPYNFGFDLESGSEAYRSAKNILAELELEDA
jgi:hypothetical protein